MTHTDCNKMNSFRNRNYIPILNSDTVNYETLIFICLYSSIYAKHKIGIVKYKHTHTHTEGNRDKVYRHCNYCIYMYIPK